MAQASYRTKTRPDELVLVKTNPIEYNGRKDWVKVRLPWQVLRSIDSSALLLLVFSEMRCFLSAH